MVSFKWEVHHKDGSILELRQERGLTELLNIQKINFAFRYSDMLGVSPKVAIPQLKVNLTFHLSLEKKLGAKDKRQ
jgi:hypothetical protein